MLQPLRETLGLFRQPKQLPTQRHRNRERGVDEIDTEEESEEYDGRDPKCRRIHGNPKSSQCRDDRTNREDCRPPEQTRVDLSRHQTLDDGVVVDTHPKDSEADE